MDIKQDEKKIINIIRYTPLLFIFIIAIVTTEIILYKKNENLENQIKLIENSYLVNNKNRVKEEIQRVYKYIEKEKEDKEDLIKEKIRNRVLEAYNIASTIFYEELNQDIENEIPSQKYILQRIKNALSGMTYDKGRGYIFMTDVSGNILLESMNKSLEGKNISDFKSKEADIFVAKTIKNIKNKSEGYIMYPWFKPYELNKKYRKLNYFMYFEALGIFIGSGEYIEDFQNELKENLLSKIKDIRFGENGYIFIYNLDGTCLIHLKSELIGVNRLNEKDEDGNLFVKDILEFAQKNKQGFISYTASINPKISIEKREKISYLTLEDEWNWVIGTGFYLDSLDTQINKEKELSIKSNNESVRDVIITASFLTLLSLLFSFYFSKDVQKRFSKYKSKIEEQKELLHQQSKMAAMGEMIGNIAHQWRQPLSTISTAATGAKFQKELNILTDEELNKSLTAINDSAQYLSEIINDFKNFFNPNNKIETEFAITKVIDKTLNMISPQFIAREIEIKKDIKNIELFSIENELIQVLVNLLNNARDALEKTKKQKKYIFINAYKEKTNLVLKIKDNANGIPENILDRIFEPYFTTKHQSQGTGIGLYMSEEIIRVHLNGVLSVKNVEYTYDNVNYIGAEFTIKIDIS